MSAEIFTIYYPDRAASNLVYKTLSELNSSERKKLGVVSFGIYKTKLKSKRSSHAHLLILVIQNSKSKNITAILKALKETIREHPLYSHIAFDHIATPISSKKLNFDSLDDPSYQEIFIRKRSV